MDVLKCSLTMNEVETLLDTAAKRCIGEKQDGAEKKKSKVPSDTQEVHVMEKLHRATEAAASLISLQRGNVTAHNKKGSRESASKHQMSFSTENKNKNMDNTRNRPACNCRIDAEGLADCVREVETGNHSRSEESTICDAMGNS